MEIELKDIENAHIELISTENVGLAEYFSVNPCYCANEDFYRQYLQLSAKHDLTSGNATTHVFIDDDANRIMGYISLRTNSFVSVVNRTITGKPALEISVLAVDKTYERRNVGTLLISKAIEVATKLHEEYAGVKYLILASDKQAVGFYEKMGFCQLTDQWEYLPTESFSLECVPMTRELNFELSIIESFVDDDDDDGN